MQTTRSRQTLGLSQVLKVSLLATTWLCSGFSVAWAGPEGGVVTHGAATIGQNGATTTINQNSGRVLIDWQSFNVGQHESVNFVQPNQNAIAVNRIHDANPSTILGQMNANGQVMLINPNGVVIGNNAKIDVGGLVVSTASPTDRDAGDFFSGLTDKLKLMVTGKPDAAIVNHGQITARDAGLVGFVAPNVINNGVIVANKGSVQLASGDTATLDLYGDGLVDVAVSDAVQQQLIEQKGWVQADGGQVVITAAAGEQIVNSVINMGGVTQAQSIDHQDGRIILKGDNSTLHVTGTLDASGYDAGQTGGTITATADHINLHTGSHIDASGDKGGGAIKIGGDYQGQGALPTAQTVIVEELAEITNSAITEGDGGSTIVWSDDFTDFSGAITATGGAQSGKGGFAEVSGKTDLKLKGKVDLSAANGEFGTLLLDPTNITIYNRSQGGTDNVNTVTTSYLEGLGANINLVADNNLVLDLTGDTLAPGTNRSVTLTATNGTISTASGGTISTTGTGGITLNAGGGITLGHTLGLIAAGGNINLNNAVTSSGAQHFRAGGTLTANAITMGANNLTLTANDLVLNGTLSGTGVLGLQPYSTNRAVNLTTNADDGTSLHLNGTDLSRIQNGWSQINIGRSDSSARLAMDSTDWLDPVTFYSGDYIALGGTISATDNATLTFGSSSTGFITTNANISATNRSIVFSKTAVLNGGTINSGGGNILFTGISVANTTSINSGGGNITTNFISRQANIPDVSDKTLTFNAGAGNIAFTNFINDTYNITATAGSMTFSSPWGSTTGMGNVSLTSINNISLPSITTAAGKNLIVNVTGVGNRITTSTITAGLGGNVSLNSDNVTIAGALSGTGTMSLQSNTAGRNLNVNYGPDNNSSYYLDTTEIDFVSDGWGLISLNSNTAYINVGTSTWKDPVKFTGGTVLYGAVSGTGNAAFTFTNGTAYINSTAASLTTTNGAIDFQSNLQNQPYADGGFAISSNSGDVTIASLINDNSSGLTVSTNGVISVGNITSVGAAKTKSLVFNAGTGTVAFTGTVTNATGTLNVTASADTITTSGAWGTNGLPLGMISLNAVDNLTLPAIYGSSITAAAVGPGSKITTSSITTGTGDNVTLTSDDIEIGGVLIGTGDLTLQTSSTSRDIGVNFGSDNNTLYHLNTPEINRLSNGWNRINIGRSINTSVTRIGTSSWKDPVVFRAGATVTFSAGAVTGTDNASFTFMRPVAVNSAASSLTTQGGEIVFQLGFTNQATGSNFNINSAGGNVSLSNINFTNGDSLNVNSGGGNITASNIFISSAGMKSVDFNAGTGTVSFLGTLTNATGMLNVNAIADTITTSGAWGSNSLQLGTISLTAVNNMTLPSIYGSSVTATVSGSGNRITTSAVATSAGQIDLTADHITLNGTLSSTGSIGLTATNGSIITGSAGSVSTSAGNILLTAGTDINLSHDMDLTTTGTNQVTLHAKGNIISSASGDITTGGGAVTLNADRDAIGGGRIELGVGTSVVSNGGNIILGGGNNPQTGYAAGYNTGHGIDLLGVTLSAGGASSGGNVFINGRGWQDASCGNNCYGVKINNNAISTSHAGIITVNAIGGGTLSTGYALHGFQMVNSTMTAVNGDISITGQVLSSTLFSHALSLGGGSIQTSGSGNIALIAANATTITVPEAMEVYNATAINAGGSFSLIADRLAASYSSLTATAAGDMIVRPYTLGTSVGVGNGSGTLKITDAILNTLTWGGTLWLGGYQNFGDVDYLTTAGNINVQSNRTFAGDVNMVAYGGYGIILDNSAITMAANKHFTLDADYMGDATTSSVTTSGTGDITLKARGGIYYGAGLTLDATGSGNVLLNAGGDIQLSSTPHVFRTNSGQLTLTAGNLIQLSAPSTFESTSGTILFNGPVVLGAAQTINAGTGSLIFDGTLNGSHNLTASAASLTFNGALGNSTPLGNVSLTTTNSLSLPSITAASILARTTGATSDLMIAAGQTLTSSGAGITLVAGRNFVNQNGANALVTNNGGRWLVYSTDVTGTTGEESLAHDFSRYSCTYNGSCPTLGSGNGLLYSFTPVLTVTPSVFGINYGDTPLLTGYAYDLAGYLGTDSSADNVTGSLTATSNYTVGDSAGSYTLDYSSGTLASALGYGFTYANNATGLTVTGMPPVQPVVTPNAVPLQVQTVLQSSQQSARLPAPFVQPDALSDLISGLDTLAQRTRDALTLQGKAVASEADIQGMDCLFHVVDGNDDVIFSGACS